MSYKDYTKVRRFAAESLKNVMPYTAYEINDEEFLCERELSVKEVASMLQCKDYNYQLLAATKKLNGHLDKASYSRIPNKHPEEAEGTKLESLNPKECQYHVHIFEIDDTVKLYGHYEIHPYPHTPYWDITRPWPRHYRPTWDTEDNPREEWTYLRGVRDPRLENDLCY